MFWLLTVFLFTLATLFVLIPVWFRTKATAFEAWELRKNANIALFQERNNELEAELATGILDQDQFDALVMELQRSLLADVTAEEQPATANSAHKRKSESKHSKTTARQFNPAIAIPILLSVLIPLMAYGLYNQWGYIEDVELMDLFQRTVDNTDNPQVTQDLIVSLGEVVQADADKPWAWYFLAENFANLNMFTEAEIAYQQSASRMQDSPEKALVLGRVALAKYINAGAAFTPEVLEAIEQARAINPNEISVLQLLAADAEQRLDYRAAIGYWRLLIQANPNSTQARMLRLNIAEAQEVLLADVQDIDAGPMIDVNLSLAEGVALDANLRVFVAVRNATREGLPPLAATFLTVASLPTSIRLDNSSAVGPFNLSSADTVFVSALVSMSGTANPRSGDYRVVSEIFSHSGQHAVIDLVITEQVP